MKVITTISVILLLCACTNANIRYGRQRGQVRQSNGFAGQQNQINENQYEYGGLRQQSVFDGDDDAEGIQQVSQNEDWDEESFINPPKYTQPPPPEAVTPKGTFIGLKETINGTGVYAFYGIPYAKPPTGELRFKRPEPADSLAEPFHATHLPDTCPQTIPDIFNNFPGEQMWAPNTNMSEDCLFLNIWVPESVFDGKEKELVPVFFWIYGGGYFSGSSSLDVYNGAKLAATEGIVVVNVQYRLGPLGFLYLEKGQGNMGLIDQSLGLQWTNQNIEYFGGNPNLVTIAGESCGAASVGFHLVSPLSKNYIKRGIMSSGLPNAKYALKPAEEMKENSLKLAKKAGCDQKTIPEIMECLRNVDSQKLITLQWKLYKNIIEFPFTPIVDGYFLPDHPDELIKKGKAKRADLIMGTVGNEGTYFILYHYINYFSHLKPTSVPYDRFVEIMNELFNEYSETEREAIIDEYTNWENPEDGYANQRNIGEALGDAIFVCPQRKFADAWANRGLGVYYYHFSQRLIDNPWGEWMGVMHGDDIPLMFGVPSTETPAEKEKLMIRNFMDMVGKFMKKGVPSEDWERYTSEYPVYLDVNATTVSSHSTPNLHGPGAKACAFWNKILPLIKSSEDCHHFPNYQNAEPFSPTHQRYQNPQMSPYGGPPHQQFCSTPMYYPPPPPPPQYQRQAACATPSMEQPTSTETSCKCTVQEESNPFVTPPPAIY